MERDEVRGTQAEQRHFIASFPGNRFPAISVTGHSCELMCARCEGRYLRGMMPCTTPEELYGRCRDLEAGGAFGVMLSGGCNEEGYVPLDSCLDVIQTIKEETNLFLAAHTGLPPGWLVRELGRAGIDLVDFELFGDRRTIKLLTGLDKAPADYRRAMNDLRRHIPHVVPHICIGAHGGELLGESAVDIAVDADPEVLVFLAFVPPSGTAFGGMRPPSPKAVGKLIAEARRRISGEISLGCMRPRGADRERYEREALMAGADRMEMPSRKTLELASGMGMRVGLMDACCSVPLGARGWVRWSNG
ncbi:MAG: hypothetical protein QW567_00900 [Candidatus Hadarchaeales archaeon]